MRELSLTCREWCSTVRRTLKKTCFGSSMDRLVVRRGMLVVWQYKEADCRKLLERLYARTPAGVCTDRKKN